MTTHTHTRYAPSLTLRTGLSCPVSCVTVRRRHGACGASEAISAISFPASFAHAHRTLASPSKSAVLIAISSSMVPSNSRSNSRDSVLIASMSASN